MEPRGDDARYMRRKVKAGLIEADHEECAIVVHYEIEATVLGEAGEPIVAERSENVKVIRLKTLTDSSDIERLAGDILSKCKLIHESKLGRVEDLLRQLQQGQAKARRSVRDGVGGGAISRARQAAQVGALSNSGSSAHVGTPSGSGEVAQLSRLDDYVERMYDGTEAATAATALVLELARVPEQLEALIENETLVGLLVRLLREEGRKSQDLALNCLYVLYAFSSFAQFHPFLVNAGVGSQILQHVGLECKRHEIREKERARDKERAEKPDRDRDKRHKLQTRKQDRLLYVCFHILLHLAEEPEIERKMAKKGLTPLLASILKRDNSELRVLALAFLKKLAVFKARGRGTLAPLPCGPTPPSDPPPPSPSTLAAAGELAGATRCLPPRRGRGGMRLELERGAPPHGVARGLQPLLRPARAEGHLRLSRPLQARRAHPAPLPPPGPPDPLPPIGGAARPRGYASPPPTATSVG